MRFHSITAITAAALLAVCPLCARAGDAGAASASKTSAAKSSAPVPGSAIAKKDGSKKNSPAKPAISITPEREAAVLTFVHRNHAELADLLAVLKNSQPEEYDRAVRDIFRTMERINQIQERDPLQYELEVAAWTAQSQVQLLAAKLKMDSTDELLKKLRDALAIQNEAKLALLRHERQKVADRLTKLDSDIAGFESDQAQIIERQLKLLTRTSGDARPAKFPPKISPKAKPAASSKK